MRQSFWMYTKKQDSQQRAYHNSTCVKHTYPCRVSQYLYLQHRYVCLRIISAWKDPENGKLAEGQIWPTGKLVYFCFFVLNLNLNAF